MITGVKLMLLFMINRLLLHQRKHVHFITLDNLVLKTGCLLQLTVITIIAMSLLLLEAIL